MAPTPRPGAGRSISCSTSPTAGYAAYAVSLSGHGGSPGRKQLDSFSILDYARDVASVVAALPAPPVLIGHSMGGFVVQKYLEEYQAPGAVLMCAVPPQGLMAAASGHDVFQAGHDEGPQQPDERRQGLAGNPARGAVRPAGFADDLKRYYKGSQSESHRAIWDMSLFGDAAHRQREAHAAAGAGRGTRSPDSGVAGTR
jgi:pimeloyl-ACP methyl ester carboxylesterase